MKNLLNVVEVTKTLRIKASSELEAVQVALESPEKEVSAVSGEVSTFVGFDSSNREDQWVNIVYVEKVLNGYRVEVCQLHVSNVQLSFLLDNHFQTVLYVSVESRRSQVISEESMAYILNEWFDHDLESGEKGRMVSFISEQFGRFTLKDGELVK